MSLSWQEISGDSRNWTLAGRRDQPARDRNDAVGAVVQFAWITWNEFTVNQQIQRQLEQWRSQAEPILSQTPTGRGMLAVACIEQIQYDSQQLQTNVGVTVYTSRTFPNSVAAMRWYEHMSSSPGGTVRTGTQAPIGSSIRRRFFWGQFIVPVGPFNVNTMSPDAMHTHGPAGSRENVARNSWRG